MSQTGHANILIVSPTPSHPQTAGNRARIYTLVSQIRDLGHKVQFLYVGKEKGDIDAMKSCWHEGFYEFHYRRQTNLWNKYRRKICGRLGLSCAYTYGIDELYDSSLDAFVREISAREKFDVVMVEYVFMSRVLENFGDDVLKVIDTHDAFTDRHKQYLAQGEQPGWFSTTADQEATGLRRADAIIAIQQHEADLFSRLSGRRVFTIGHIVKLFPPGRNKVVPGRILMLGSANRINTQGAEYFIRDILPGVRKQLPHVELAIAGSVCESIANQPGVVCLGEVHELRPVYESAEIVINPVLFGTGLKVKSLEALSHAKPLVTTTAGAAGMEEGINHAFRVSDSSQGFADIIVELVTSPEIADKLSESAHAYASDVNKQYIDRLDELMNVRQVDL